jgi:hypothetical protein
MLAGNWKSYQDFVSRTDYLEEYNEPDKEDIWEKWIEDWEETNGKADKETEDILWEFFDKVVYPDYFDGNTNCSDWSLEEIKDKLLDWYITNYDKAINQLGCLIRDVQRKGGEENEVLKQSRHLYINQTGSCI